MRKLLFAIVTIFIIPLVFSDENVSIISLTSSYSNGLNTSGLGDTVFFRMNVTGMNESTVLFAYMNASDIGCDSLLNLTYNATSGLWENSCEIASYLDSNVFSIIGKAGNTNGSEDSASVTIYADTMAPNVTLISPSDDAYTRNITTVYRFNFSVSDFMNLGYCSFYLDGELKAVKDINRTGTYYFNNIEVIVSEKAYLWNITCNDTLGNINNMTARTLNVDYTAPEVFDWPAVNDTSIHRYENITILLSENSIDDSTVSTTTVNLKDNSNNAVRFALYLEDDTIIIDPYTYLYDNYTYKVTLGSIKDRAGNAMSFSSTIYFETYPLNLSRSDSIVGNSSHVYSNIGEDSLNFTSDGVPLNFSAVYSTSRRINLSNGTTPVFSVVYSFLSGAKLELQKLMVKVNEIPGKGSTIVNGISGTKNLYVKKVDPTITGVCVRSAALFADDFSEDCTGTGEAWYNCTINSSKCRDLQNGYLKVTGLSGTGVVQMNDTVPPEITDIVDDVEGDDLSFTVETDTNATCRAKRVGGNASYYSMPVATETDMGLEHDFEEENIGDGTYTYYVSCIDPYGNPTYSSFQFTIGTSDEDEDEDEDSGGTGGGGGGGSSTAVKFLARKYVSWDYIEVGEAVSMSVDSAGIPITRIDFTVGADNTDNPSLEVRVLEKKPSSVSTPIGTVHSYMEFYPLRLYTVRSPKISFRVPIDWLDGGRDPKGILLLRYFNRNWTILDTSLRTLDNEYAYYEAQSTGFSYFAIVGTISAPPKVKPVTAAKTTAAPIDTSSKPKVEAVDILADTGNAIITDEKTIETIEIPPKFSISDLKPSTRTANGIAIILLIVSVGLIVYRQIYAKHHHPSYRVVRKKR